MVYSRWFVSQLCRGDDSIDARRLTQPESFTSFDETNALGVQSCLKIATILSWLSGPLCRLYALCLKRDDRRQTTHADETVRGM